MSGLPAPLARVEALIFDVDGVLREKNAAVRGAAETLTRLTGAGIPYRLLTNTTSASRRQLTDDLVAAGLPVEREQVFCPPHAAGEYLRQRGLSAFLLVQESVDGKWCMPGGWADVGEGPVDAIAREVREESGFTVHPHKIAGVYDANRGGVPLEFYHAYKIVFLCTCTGGEARPSDETLAVDFFDFDDLPPLSSDRTHPRHLREVRAHLEDPNRPTALE